MADYPDYFELIQIVGADIMVPIDVQGAYIMMPVDIQAQYLTLEIDIVAQTVGNISIDLAAQTIGNLAVNISAQDLAQLTIDIDAQSVGIYLQPEWSALQGLDKNFRLHEGSKVRYATVILEYVVPAGKTFYLCGAAFSLRSGADADGDKPQQGVLGLQYYAPVVSLCDLGGDGGGFLPFAKPLVIAAGKTLKGVVTNYSNHTCSMSVSMWGYEL